MKIDAVGKAIGGRALAQKMTQEERKAKSQVMLEAKKRKAAMLRATHSGELLLGDVAIPCHVLENETRVISGRGMQNSIGFSRDSSGLSLQNLINSKLEGFLSTDSLAAFKNPIPFVRVGSGGSAPDTDGFDATILIDICDALIRASKVKGILTKSQMRYADQADIIIRSVAKVGIVALVDEATGFQKDRAKDALSKILESFIAKELQPYLETFPSAFYEQLFRLRGLDYPTFSVKRPQYFGLLTNDIVYKRLAPGVLAELKQVTPKNEDGRRKHKYFQRLTGNIGYPKLMQHLGSIVTIMKLSKDYQSFINTLDQMHPRYGDTIMLPFEYRPEKDDGKGL